MCRNSLYFLDIKPLLVIFIVEIFSERLHFHFHVLEKEMATHSSVLAQRIPGMVEPGGLPSLGSHGIGHD